MALEKEKQLKDYQEEYLQMFKEQETQQYLNMQQLATERQCMYNTDQKYKERMQQKFLKFDKTVEGAFNKAILQSSLQNNIVKGSTFIPKTQYGLEQQDTNQQKVRNDEQNSQVQDASLLLQQLEDKQKIQDVKQTQKTNTQQQQQEEQLDNLQNKDIIKQYIYQIQKLNKKYGQQEEFIAKLQKSLYGQVEPLDLQQLYNDISAVINKASINSFLQTKVKTQLYDIRQQLGEVKQLAKQLENLGNNFQNIQDQIDNSIQIYQLSKKMNKINKSFVIYLQGVTQNLIAQHKYNYYISTFQCDVLRQNSTQQFYNNFVGFLQDGNQSIYTIIDYTQLQFQNMISLVKLINLDKQKWTCCVTGKVMIGSFWFDLFNKQQVNNDSNYLLVQINDNQELFRLTQIIQNKLNDVQNCDRFQLVIDITGKLAFQRLKQVKYTCIKQETYTEQQLNYNDNVQILL